MARNQTLLQLLQDYRAEVRASGNVAHNANVRDTQVRLLQRHQETLYDEVDWSHLRVERFQNLQAGQRFYDTPDDLSIERLEKIEVRYGDQWEPLFNGIRPEHYSQWDSYRDERSWPVERWQVYEADQIEVWPIPADNADPASLEGQLRLTGIRTLRPLVQDDDRADLDDRLIVLFAAAETLAAQGAPDAGLKLKAAQQRKMNLVGNHSKKSSFALFGAGQQPQGRQLRGPPRVHYRTTT